MTSRTPSTTRRTWKGVPLDERQAERREALLDAAFDLLGTDGASGTTVRAVCQRARLNPRYFYESFADLDELLVATFDRASHQVHSAVLAAGTAHEDDPPAAVRAALTTLVRTITDDPRVARVLYIEGLGNEALSRRRVTVMQEMAELLASEAATRHGDPRHADRIAIVAANLMMGGLAELMVTWLHGRLDLTLDELVDDATGLFLAIGEAAESIARQRRPRRLDRGGPSGHERR